MSQAMWGFLLSFVLSAVLGAGLIPVLRRLKAGQSIREEGPKWHMSKQGTPTMGGLMFIAAVTVTVFTVGLPGLLKGDSAGVFVLIFALVFGAIGFWVLPPCRSFCCRWPLPPPFWCCCGPRAISPAR